MCYAIPGKIKEINDRKVEVDYFGEQKFAHNEIDGLVVGDYVYAQGGYVIKKIPKDEAEEILSVWRETFFELQQVDVNLSRMDLEEKGIDKKVLKILDKAMEGNVASKEEIIHLMNLNKKDDLGFLFKSANFIRQKYLKNSCCVHGILEISNYCDRNCYYCGISSHNIDIKRYSMSPEEIVEAAVVAIDRYGFKALVLQSGESCEYSIEELSWVIKTIKEKAPALIFISFGEVGIDGLEKLFKAGARGLLLRFETSNHKLYEKLHPGFSLETRLLHIRKAFEMGYLIITGGLVGLPGQSKEDLVNDIYLAKALNTEMYSFGPFLPNPNTPLADEKIVSQDDMLKMLACTRLVDPKEARVLVTTAFETLSSEARKRGMLSGANSVMLNVTPVTFRKLYNIYPNRAYQEDPIQSQINETLALLGSLGRAPTDLGVK